MFFKLFLSSIGLGWAIIVSVYANPSTLPIIQKKEFWRAIDEKYPAALERKHIPPKYFKECKKKLTPLNHAILNKDIAMVRLLIEKGADVNYPDKDQDTPLHAAVIIANKEIVDLLLEYPVHLDARNGCGQTPLFIAIKNNQYNLVVKLVSRGANKEIKGKIKSNGVCSYRTPIEIAIQSNPKIAAYLIQSGVDLYQKGAKSTYPIVDAVLYERDELVDLMRAQGVPLFYQEKVGFTVLHAAAFYTSAYFKRYLDLAPVGKEHQQDENGCTPMHYGSQYGDREMIALLLERGANLHIIDKQGRQPLHMAIDHSDKTKQLAIAHLLIQQGADVNAADKDNQFTVLGRAVEKGNIELVKLLLEHKANIEQLSTNPLYFKRSMWDKLSGKSVKFINSQTSLLHLAIIKNHTAIARFLLARHPDFVNQRDAFGCTPLHYAALLDNIEIIHDLLKHGASLYIRDKQEGYTPIEFAKNMKIYTNENSNEPMYHVSYRSVKLLENWKKEQKKKTKK